MQAKIDARAIQKLYQNTCEDNMNIRQAQHTDKGTNGQHLSYHNFTAISYVLPVVHALITHVHIFFMRCIYHILIF